MNWLIEVIQKHFWRVIVYTFVSVSAVAIFFLAFKDRITQKTVNQAGSISNHFYEHAQIKSTFGCQSLGAEKFMKLLKENK